MRAVRSQMFLILIISLILFGGCGNSNNQTPVTGGGIYNSYIDIPGVTEEEKKAIDSIKRHVTGGSGYLMYSALPSTEAFYNNKGEISGFSALLCEWLTDLFGIPFKPEFSESGYLPSFVMFDDDVTGNAVNTGEQQRVYYMTTAVAQQLVKLYRLADARPLEYYAEFRPLRFAFMQGFTAINEVISQFESGKYEVIFVSSADEAYRKLKSGEADAFIDYNMAEAFFDIYGDVLAKHFFPLIYSPVFLVTQNPDYEAIVSVVQKALDDGALRHLTKLYNMGHNEYLKHKLYMQLTEEERAYIIDNPAVLIGVDPGNYPGCFFDKREKEWRGISLDILDEISALTGLTFERVNDENTEWPVIIRKLEAGEIALVPEMNQLAERRDRFIWPDTVQMIDHYALISKSEYPDTKFNEILFARVGLTSNTSYTVLFREWFPNHYNTIEYESVEAAFAALQEGKVDMVMANQKRLLFLTHYLELPNYKINVMFDYPIEIKFGLNKNETELCSILDKALKLIDTEEISGHWMRRTYDYRVKVGEELRPVLAGLYLLLFSVVVLVAVLFIRSRRAGKILEKLVERRTQELKMQSTTLTTLFDSIPDIIFIKDKELRYIQCNKAFLDFFGKTKEEVVNKDDEGIGLSKELADEFRNLDRRIINERRTEIVEEYSLSVSGMMPLFETIKTPLILDDATIGVLGIARDITKHKEMENKISYSYEYAKKLSDALAIITRSTAIFTGNLETASDIIAQEGCVALNTFSVSVWKIIETENAMECISCFDSYTGDNPIKNKFDLSNRNDYVKRLKKERLIVMNNGDECKSVLVTSGDYFNSLCAALYAPIHIDGKLVGVVCVDQMPCKEYPKSRIWEMEEQNFASSLADLMALAISSSDRRKALDAAELASQAKSSFLANMSHEIRTPMNSILGVTEILIQNESLPAEIEEGLGKIYSSCDMLLGIINDILDISKIEAGKLDIMPAAYIVASLVNDSVHLNMMRIDSKPIEFDLKIDENIPARLIGDELRIKQILNNLLSNAFKYTEKGNVTLSISAEPNPDKNMITIVFSIQDTGVGMTNEQLGKMFEKYSRFNQQKNNVEGTGLGLAITRRLVSLMNGGLNVESEPGKGSLFVVRLPQEKIDSNVIGKDVAANLQQFRMNYISQRKRGQIIRDPMPYGSVLIVDDVETNLYVAVGLMKLYRLKIETVMSGQEAIDKLKNGNVYDIVFMDHMMPEMDGIETTKKIREWEAEQPEFVRTLIVALTANAVAGQADMFLKSGFDDFISKPIDIRQLNAVLNKFIRDKQPQEVIDEARKQKMDIKDLLKQTPQTDSLLMDSFIRDADKTAVWLEENSSDYSSEEVLRKFTVMVHGIKSSLYNIGETDLSAAALKLEKAARDSNIEEINANAPGFLKDLKALLKRLEASRVEYEVNEDTEEIKETLAAIQEKAADFDRKGALDLIAQIKNCSKETKKALDIITEHIMHSEFEEAENAAAFKAVELALAGTPAGTRLLNKEITGLNVAKGLLRYGCDEKTYLRVLRSYAASVRSMLGVVESAGEDSLNDYKIKVHGIKGTSYDIFAGDVGSRASALEDAVKSGDLAYIKEHNPKFLEIARKMVYDIEELVFGIEAENPRPKKDKPEKEELLKLLAACKDYDMDGIDEAISEIEKYQYESDDGLTDWLRESVDRMDLKQIIERLGG
ncbi:MAG: ATP-binding protein [Treponema sp.]|nr:ATP-binding protein [Treponema sp.]